MKKIIFFILVATTFLFASGDDEKQIKDVIQTSYVEGLQNEGDFAKIDKGFHSCFKLLGIKDGNDIWELSIADWKKRIKSRKEKGDFPKSDENKVTVKFDMIDITGDAAIAKFKFYVGEKFKYVDYLSLYKFTDGWKIVGKIYHQVAK